MKDLIGSRKHSLNVKSKLQMFHVEKVDLIKTKNTVNKYSLANVKLESFENWTLGLAQARFHLSFVNTANGKEICQGD